MQEKNYTTKEVQEILRLHNRTINRYCKSGKLKAFKIGNDWRIPETALQDFLKARNLEVPKYLNTNTGSCCSVDTQKADKKKKKRQ